MKTMEVYKMNTPGFIAQAENGWWTTSMYRKVALRNLIKLLKTEQEERERGGENYDATQRIRHEIQNQEGIILTV